jgi:hypothetical protein
MKNTSARDFYKNMNDIVKDRRTKEDFYTQMAGNIFLNNRTTRKGARKTKKSK